MFRIILLIGIIISGLWAQYPSDWEVDPQQYEYIMTVTALTEINGSPIVNQDDVLAVFHNDECRGVSEPFLVGDIYMHFLVVYSNDQGIALTFKAWDSEVGNTVDLEQVLSFDSGGAMGTVGEPYLLTGTNSVSLIIATTDYIVQFEDDLSPPPIPVISNDIYNPDLAVILTLVTPAVNGDVLEVSEDAFQYISFEDFFGRDSFQYAISNIYAADSAWVYLEINDVNEAPHAFHLLLPQNGYHHASALQTELVFNWEIPLDDEDDPLTFNLHFTDGVSWDTSFAPPANSWELNVEAFPRDVWLDWSLVCHDPWAWVASQDTFQLKIHERVSIDHENSLPEHLILEQNFPNPFNPTSSIIYYLPESADVSFHVFDVRGVQILKFELGLRAEGRQIFSLDLSDSRFSDLHSGIYFYRIITNISGNHSQANSATQRMVILK